MKMEIIEIKGQKIAEIQSEEVVMQTEQEALDIMADASYYGAKSIIIRAGNLSPDFFELRTRVAGDILQKFSNYMVKLAIIGDFEKYTSNSLQAFIAESNRGNQVFFVPDKDQALAKLAG